MLIVFVLVFTLSQLFMVAYSKQVPNNQTLDYQLSLNKTIINGKFNLDGKIFIIKSQSNSEILRINSYSKPEYQLQFSDDAWILNGGCNSFFGSYLFNKQLDASLKTFRSTQRQCNVDYDNEILNAFKQTTKFSIDRNKIYLTNYKGQKLAILIDKNSSKQLQGTYIFQQLYQKINLYTRITITFTQNIWKLQGICNNHYGTYEISQSGKLNFNYLSNTKINCKFDIDYIYINIIRAAASIKQNGNALSLFSINGTILARLLKQQQKLLLEGSYLFTQYLNNNTNTKTNVIIYFKTGNQWRFTGKCNEFFGTYIIRQKKISFLTVGNTQKYCPENTDNFFKLSLQNAVRANKRGKDIQLIDKQNKLIGIFSKL